VVKNSLILTVTRACNLRCSYCPRVKAGWPSLSNDDITKSIDLFCQLFGGGEIKIFGGEPLLVPDQVRYAIEEAEKRDAIKRIYLSTNGLGLDGEWLDFLSDKSKVILTVSLDGRPGDNRKMRRALDGVPDAYSHIVSLRDSLVRLPRFVITQTIAPALAKNAADNFIHLCDLGFRKFNFLPGYFIPWRSKQLLALRRSFDQIRAWIEESWKKGNHIYIRNLFIRAPTPFFNTGLIVDSDGSIHPSNLGLSGTLDHLRSQTRVGDIHNPPTTEQLTSRAAEINKLLESELSPRIWESTLAADKELSRFCSAIWPAFVSYRKARNVA